MKKWFQGRVLCCHLFVCVCVYILHTLSARMVEVLEEASSIERE